MSGAASRLDQVMRSVVEGRCAMLSIMWRERILMWTAAATFHDGASASTLRACEAALGQGLPNDLAELPRR